MLFRSQAENQASAYWDGNGDGQLNDSDQNIKNNIPAVSDDPGTSEKADPTIWLRDPSPEENGEEGVLPMTGIDPATTLLIDISLTVISLGMLILAAGIITTMSRRRREKGLKARS